jgi:predicted ATPase
MVYVILKGIGLYKIREMPGLYIIGGCNGAGKTTASFTILPEILNCREFVNAIV